MAYKRQLAYLEEIYNGEKRGSKGFCKWEERNGMHDLEVTIKGLCCVDDGEVRVQARNGKELGKVKIKNGSGFAKWDRVNGGVKSEWDFSKITILLEENWRLEAEYENSGMVGETEKRKVSEQTGLQEEFRERIRQTELQEEFGEKSRLTERKERPDTMQPEPRKERPDTMQPEPRKEHADTILPEPRKEHADTILPEPRKEYTDTMLPEPREEPVGLTAVEEVLGEKRETEKKMEESVFSKPSLWELMEETYEKINPYGTEEQYYKISLEDIFLLQENYHILRKNQFLLHGYYNYKYLILGRKEGEEEKYWLGVPGIYHEREKMAARMYGFEKFEGTKRRYGVGDLGYYLLTVE